MTFCHPPSQQLTEDKDKEGIDSIYKDMVCTTTSKAAVLLLAKASFHNIYHLCITCQVSWKESVCHEQTNSNNNNSSQCPLRGLFPNSAYMFQVTMKWEKKNPLSLSAPGCWATSRSHGYMSLWGRTQREKTHMLTLGLSRKLSSKTLGTDWQQTIRLATLKGACSQHTYSDLPSTRYAPLGPNTWPQQ